MSLLSGIARVGRQLGAWIGSLLGGLFTLLFGRLSWSAPPWGRWLLARMRAAVLWSRENPRRLALLLLALIVLGSAGYFGLRWWKARPQPTTVSFKVAALEATDIANGGLPNPLVVSFDASVAPLPDVGKEVTQGVVMRPELAGTWRWRDQRTLVFQPKEDWPVGQDQHVDFGRTLLSSQTVLAEYGFDFRSPSFTVQLQSSEFYQDPVNPGIKKAVFDLAFSHPLQIQDLEKRLALSLSDRSGGLLGPNKGQVKFTLSYDKLRLHAYVHSESLPIPAESSTLELTLAEGVHAARGGRPTEHDLTGLVEVPGLYSLGINNIELQVVDNEKNEPEQVLLLETSMAVHEKEMAKAVSVWVLPKLHPDKKRNSEDGSSFSWSAGEVTPAVLKAARKLVLEALPAEREYTEMHSFRYNADVGLYVYVQVEKGLRAYGGYLLGDRLTQVNQVPPFPAELKILSEGSLLPLSGEKKVAVLVRDLPGMKLEVGRVLPSQLQHLVSQSSGTFTDPSFWGSFGLDNLVERFERKIPLKLQRGKAHYEAVDLGTYLKSDGQEKRGIFLLSVKGYDPAQDNPQAAPVDEEMADEEMGGETEYVDPSQKEDRRLVVVTDLGILAKRSSDGSQDVFVQSIHSGEPVAGATVEVLGRNGVALMTQTTDASGRARFAKLEGFTRERAPLLYLVKKAGDMTFLPLGRGDRSLDFSRFDVGGIDNARSADQLSAYLFSDRGIYRPGESFHIGMIVKAADWAKKVEGLPLEAEVVDARGLVVKRETIRLGPAGFNELEYKTQEVSPTGTYSINLYIIKDGKASQQIGTTTVRVQEFLPDRMKVKTSLSQDVAEGWVSPTDLKALVFAQNLFGTPAENRRVEATLTLSPAFPAFRSHPDYVFYDPLRAKEGYSEKLEDGLTDQAGNAEFKLGLERYAKATYRLHFLARVFEPEGGRGVASDTAMLVSEMPFLVGFKADGDLAHVSKASKRAVSLIAIDPSAKRTTAKGLKLQLYERKVVSVLTRQGSGVYKYESRRKEILVKENSLEIPATGFNLGLASETPGDFVYVVRTADGLEMNRVEYSVAGAGNVSRSLERNAELQLTLNKKDYQPGEEIEISIRAPYVGAGLITIERDKVYAQQWFKTSTTASVQKIRLPKDYEGNGYISVQFIRDPASDEIFTSPLSYGVVPFVTSLSSRTTTLKLNVPELVKPGQKLSMHLNSSQPGRVVVFAVDEGILQVARYKLADPLGHFFQKRRLEVSTAQILDLILPEFRKLMAASAPGGDEEGALGRHLNPFKRRHDQPAVYWSGIVDIKEGGDFSYTVPETFNGSLRVMAVSVAEGAVGVTQASTLVRGDFVISPNAPLAVAPGDEFEVSVGLSNNVKGSGASPAVTLALKSSAHFEVLGAASQTLNVGEMREGVALFRLRAKTADQAVLGSGTLAFTASLGQRSSRLSTDVSVRPASPFETDVRVGSFKGKHELPVARRLHPEFRQVEAAVSPLPLAATAGLSAYLGNFNHACTEQLVSQAMAPLILGHRPEFASSKAAPPGKRLGDVLAELRTRQNAEGGFGLWTASAQADEFASVYAAHLLMEARERGEKVPDDMFRLSQDYLTQLAASHGDSLSAVRTRLYAAYLLTRQGVVTTALLASQRETLERNHAKAWTGDLAAVYLAASYQLLKQDRQAGELITPAVDVLGKRTAPFAYAAYYDPLTHDSRVIYLLARHFPDRLKRLPADTLIKLMEPLQRGSFNTQSAASLILALDAYANVAGAQAVGNLGLYELDKAGKRKDLPVTPKSLLARAAFSNDAAKLGFVAGSDLNHFYSVSEAGFDREPARTELKAGMEVFREYLDAKGKPVSSVKLGDEVTVRLRLRGINRSVGSVAVVDLLPGGLEPVLVAAPSPDDENAGQEAGGDRLGGRGNWASEYLDVREDRVVLYGSVGSEMSEYSYRAKAVAAGTFVVPPAYAEALYEREVKARAPASSLTVQRPGK